MNQMHPIKQIANNSKKNTGFEKRWNMETLENLLLDNDLEQSHVLNLSRIYASPTATQHMLATIDTLYERVNQRVKDTMLMLIKMN